MLYCATTFCEAATALDCARLPLELGNDYLDATSVSLVPYSNPLETSPPIGDTHPSTHVSEIPLSSLFSFDSAMMKDGRLYGTKLSP